MKIYEQDEPMLPDHWRCNGPTVTLLVVVTTDIQ